MLSVLALFSLVSVSRADSNVRMNVSPWSKECVYFEKKSGEWLTMHAEGTHKFDISSYGPEEHKLLMTKRKVSKHNVVRSINTDGNYGFCFSNTQHVRLDISVRYDFLVDSKGKTVTYEEKIEADLQKEREEIWTEMIKKLGIRLMEKDEQAMLDAMKEVAANSTGAVTKEPADRTTALIRSSMALLSLHTDQMNMHLSAHKRKTSKHIKLQQSNLYWVKAFSLMMIFTIILCAMVQVTMIKGILSKGRYSWRIWIY